MVLVGLILPWGFGVMGLSVPFLVAASCKSHLPPAGIPVLWHPWGAVPPPGGPSLRKFATEGLCNQARSEQAVLIFAALASSRTKLLFPD